MINEDKREINDTSKQPHKYYCRQLPATQGLALKFKLVQLLGPAISELKDLKLTGDVDKLDKGNALEAFGKVITALFKDNDPEAVVTFLQSLVFHATRDGERLGMDNFDVIFTGNELEFYKACAFVLEVNFGNFFGGLKLGGKFKGVMDTLSTQ